MGQVKRNGVNSGTPRMRPMHLLTLPRTTHTQGMLPAVQLAQRNYTGFCFACRHGFQGCGSHPRTHAAAFVSQRPRGAAPTCLPLPHTCGTAAQQRTPPPPPLYHMHDAIAVFQVVGMSGGGGRLSRRHSGGVPPQACTAPPEPSSPHGDVGRARLASSAPLWRPQRNHVCLVTAPAKTAPIMPRPALSRQAPASHDSRTLSKGLQDERERWM